MQGLIKKPTQCEKVLKALQDAEGVWVSGKYFLRELYLSQYHARIFELQHKGYEIEASKETDEHGFKSYRILKKGQLNLI
jgi:biotin operon repressor